MNLMPIYIDGNYLCHTSNPGGYREIKTDFFDGKCSEFIEGYRFVPSGETWTSPLGVVISGESIFPAVDYKTLERLQASFDEGVTKSETELADLQFQIAESEAALSEIESALGVNT